MIFQFAASSRNTGIEVETEPVASRSFQVCRLTNFRE
jgi:hypothetical protein